MSWMWTIEETKCLISLWGEKKTQEQLAGTRTFLVWQKLLKNFCDVGFSKDLKQIKAKVNNLKTEYQKEKRKIDQTGRASQWPYFDQIDEILGDKPLFSPNNLIENSAEISENSDYCWTSSFENGLFYIENWQTGHKFRAIVGLTDMTVQLLSARAMPSSHPTVRRINGILHFLTDHKLNFFFPSPVQATNYGHISVQESYSRADSLITSCGSPAPPTCTTPLETRDFNLVKTSNNAAYHSSAFLQNSPDQGMNRSESHNNITLYADASQHQHQAGGTAIIEDTGPVSLPPTSNLQVKDISIAESNRLLGPNFKINKTPVSERMCPICRRVFSNRSMLRRHMVVHSSVPAFVCEMCGKGFKYRWNYSSHIREKCPKLESKRGANKNPGRIVETGGNSNTSVESALRTEIQGLEMEVKKEIE